MMAVCSKIHTKHIITVCGQNVELLNVKLAVHIVTSVRDYSQLRSNNNHFYNVPLFSQKPKYFLIPYSREAVACRYSTSDLYSVISKFRYTHLRLKPTFSTTVRT